MQIVMEIDDDVYKRALVYKGERLTSNIANDLSELITAVANGTPLDRIKAEIDRQEKWLLQAGYTAYNVDIALDSIKSVVAESEVRND